jgi:hypothetical protein
VANSWGGLAAVALFVAWLAYFVPLRVAARDQLVGARTGDRFSGSLRVLAVAGGAPSVPTPSVGVTHAPAASLMVAAPPSHAAQGSGGEPGRTIVRTGRPTAVPDAARRGAAARRRLLLTLALIALTFVMGVGALAGPVSWIAVAVPALLLAAVLLLSRRAVASARRAEAARFEAARSRAIARRRAALGAPPLPRSGERLRVTGHAVRTSQNATQMIPRVTAEDLERASIAAARRTAQPGSESQTTTARAQDRPSNDDAEPLPGEQGSAPSPAAHAPVPEPAEPRPPSKTPWEPVPVPRPTYTLKATAGRPPAPEQPEPAPTTVSASASARGDDAGLAGLAAPGTLSSDVIEEPSPTTETLGLSLDAILARRRASGE